MTKSHGLWEQHYRTEKAGLRSSVGEFIFKFVPGDDLKGSFLTKSRSSYVEISNCCESGWLIWN